MSLDAVTHINFRGQAREALDFYRSVFGGEVAAVTYAQMNLAEDPADAGNLAWGQVASEHGPTIMAYDVQSTRDFDRGERSFYIALSGEERSQVEASWNGLADGGTILTPIGPSSFSPFYGMLTDRYGVTWIVSVRP